MKYLKKVTVAVLVVLPVLALIFHQTEFFGSRIFKQVLMSKQLMIDLQVYGRVLDQYDTPVVGAELKSYYIGAGYSKGHGDHIVHTDSNGGFVLSGQGQEINVYAVSHPEITRVIWHDDRRGGKRVSDIRFDAKYFTNKNRIGSNPKSPIIFRVYRVHEYEDVKLYRGPIVKAKHGDSREKFHLNMKCSIPKTTEHAVDIRLTPTGTGGFMSIDDKYVVAAPETGYVNPSIDLSFELQASVGQESRSFGTEEHLYYYTADSAEVYGAFSVAYSAVNTGRDTCVVAFQFIYFNDNGSTNIALSSDREDWWR